MAVIIFISLIPVSRTSGDDLVYGAQVNQLGSLPWYVRQMTRWSGRAFSEAMVAIFLPLSQWVWRVFNTAFLCLLVYSLARLAFRKADSAAILLSFCGFWLLSPSIMIMTSYWVVGSFNYNWPMALALFSAIYLLSLYRRETIPTWQVWLCVLAAGAGSLGVEQIAPCLFAFSLLTIIALARRHEKIPAALWVYWALTTVNFIFQVCAPGPRLRAPHEAAHWYPEFTHLSIAQKVSRGIAWQFTYVSQLLLPLAIVGAVLLLLRFTAESHLPDDEVREDILMTSHRKLTMTSLCLTGASLMIVMCAGALRMDLGHFARWQELRSTFLRSATTYGVWTLFAVGLFLSALLLSTEPWVESFLYLAGMAAAALMYFSPTIYASGARTLFAPGILFVLLVLRQLGQIRTKRMEDWLPAVLVAAVGLTNLLHFMAVITQRGYSNTLFPVFMK